jgi:hypothetical protein
MRRWVSRSSTWTRATPGGPPGDRVGLALRLQNDRPRRRDRVARGRDRLLGGECRERRGVDAHDRLRIDYLAPGTEDFRAEAEVVRNGSSVGCVDVIVEIDARHVATARGVFKTAGSEGGADWTK